MNGHFISRSGTRHIIGSSDSKLHGGRTVALCDFSQSPHEKPPSEAIQLCGWCLEAEDQVRQIAQTAFEAAGQPRQDPEASA